MTSIKIIIIIISDCLEGYINDNSILVILEKVIFRILEILENNLLLKEKMNLEEIYLLIILIKLKDI